LQASTGVRAGSRIPRYSLIFALLVLLWSAINPHDRFTWWLEVAPALVALPILLLTYKRFRFTDLVCVLIALHACILMVGGKYTYAEVPAFNWLRDHYHLARNSYDGMGHFAQGFVPALVMRELLLRTSPLKQGKWLFAIIVFSCLGISALYEIFEWAVAIRTGTGADAFLGTQGDPWDTQKDMALAGIGAVTGLLLLSKLHDRDLKTLKNQQ
jgi:putative membrane protein